MRSVLGYAIWLYGSHSRGVVDEFSDIDVLFVSESELDDKVVYDVFESPTGISISRYSWEEMERMAEYGSLFLRHVALEGRVVFETAQARAALAPYLRAELVVRVRSSEFVPQFEGEGHGDELGVAVPHQLRAGRVACAPEPPAEARDQTDGVAEARRRRQLA